MKKFILLFLFCSLAAFGQGVYLPARTVTGTVNGISRPIASATVTVCAANAGGIPCAPALANALWQTSSLNSGVAVPNPFTTDANGNYPQVAISPGIYTVTESAPGYVGYTYQLSASLATTTTSGSGNVVLSIGPTLLNALLTTPTINGPTTTGTDNGVETMSNKTLASPTINTPTVTSPFTTGTDTGSETLQNKTLASPVISGTPSGTGIPTVTLKKGSGAGNYTTSSATYVQIDSTNLLYTVTIPTGWKLAVFCTVTTSVATALTNLFLGLADGGGVVYEAQGEPAAINVSGQLSIAWSINGDGNSHTIDLRFHTGNASDQMTVGNSGSVLPSMVFILTPSN